MKINGLRNSFPVAAATLLSLSAFAIFVTLYTFSDHPGRDGSMAVVTSAYDTIPPKKTNIQDSLYKALLGSADKYFNEKDYEKSQAELIKAQQIKPLDQTLKARITQLNGLVATQKEQAEASRKSAASGDAYFSSKDYLNAKASYQLAVSQNPNDEIVREKLRKTLDLLRSQKAQNILFDVAVSSADKLFQAGDYEKALLEYENAGKLLPSDPYPKNKINEIIKIQVDNKVKEEEYTKAIAMADQSFLVKNYQDALLDYKKAAGIKPQEKYPKDRITELTGLIATQKARDDAYNKAIELADQSFTARKYPEAISSYKEAIVIKPEQTYPRDKIKEIEDILTRMTNAQKAYDTYITLADSFYIDKKYFKARENYSLASMAKPSEAYPKEMITKADKMLTGQEAAMANAMKDQEEQYKRAITAGDLAFSNKVYEIARSEFQNALKIKPDEVYPKSKIAEIDKLEAAYIRQKAADSRYANTIGKADSMFMAKAYLPAKSEFQHASNMKPDEVYPKNKIVEINMILYNLEMQQKQELQYGLLITKADKLLEAKSFAMAKTEYANASAIKPQEAYPKEKITQIEKILVEQATAKVVDDKYAGIIASAEKLLAAKSYEQAKTEFQNAGLVKPAETYPGQKIAEIDRILAGIAAARSLEENYRAAIASADKLFEEKDYNHAKTEYTKASALKPAEKYPITKISDIDAILAGIASLKAIDDAYDSTIVNADKLFADKSYELSKTAYQNALKIKPEERYPKEKITEIDKTLTELAAMKDRDERYAAMIVHADKLLSEKSYEPARAEYLNASAVKPQERYPKDKIAEIDATLAGIAAALKTLEENYQAAIASADRHLGEKDYVLAKSEYSKAAGLKPAETYPVAKIAEIDVILKDIARLKAIDDEYAAIIVNADKLLGEKSYELSKGQYQSALQIKPAEQYPKEKIAEIDKTIAELASIKDRDDRYTAAIAGADKLLNDKSYDLAITAYVEAGKIKPAEQYPKDKVIEINEILAAIAKQKTLDDQYSAALAKADQLLEARTFDKAKLEYTNALNLKPSEQYPKDKIAGIDRVLAELKATEDAYKASITSADLLLAQKKFEEARKEYQNALTIKPLETYPVQKIAEINKALEELLGKQKYYDNLLVDADNSFKDKDYSKAKDTYQQALDLFPAQPYPRTQINLITARVDSLYRANKSLYDKAVADGDRFFNSFEFDKAVDAYTDAINFLPMEKYPREMIVKIRRTIAENAIADVLKTPVIITSNNEKQFSFTPVNIASRKNNFVYIKIKNLSGKPFNVLMRYGKDKQANGGVVMRNLSIDGKMNERLVSVRDQDLWSREDNNWISLYPQGGDVEVSFIQVSRAK